jgi:hypothetical protein
MQPSNTPLYTPRARRLLGVGIVLFAIAVILLTGHPQIWRNANAVAAADGSIGVKTVNSHGSDADTFTAHIDGGPGFTISVQTAAVQLVDLGPHTVTEASGAYYDYIGYAVVPGPADNFTCPASPQATGPAPVSLTANSPEAGVCLYNARPAQLGVRAVNIGGAQNDQFVAKVNFSWQINFSAIGPTWSGVDTGQYNVHELPTAGYTYLGYALSDTSVCPPAAQAQPGDASFIVGYEDKVVCFYNQKTAIVSTTGVLHVAKVNVGGAQGDSFTFDVSNGGPSNVSFSAQAAANVPVAAGPHDVSEDASPNYIPLGWSLAASSTSPCPAQPQHATEPASVNIIADATTAICFYNQPAGHIHIRKVNIGGNQADSFTAHIDGGAGFAISAAAPEVVKTVAFGDHVISEDPAPGYALKEIAYFPTPDFEFTCPDPAKLKAGSTVPVTVDFPEVTVCVYNESVTATIVVQKIYQAKGYLPQPGDEPTITIGGQAPDSHTGIPATQWIKAVNVAPGGTDINVQEFAPFGWEVVAGFGDSCSGPAGSNPTTSVTLSSVKPGEFRYVCFINRPVGSIKIVKIDKTAGHSSWSFTVTGPAPVGSVSVAGGNPGGGESTTVAGLPLALAKYNVSEDQAGPSSCFGGAGNATYWTQQTTGVGGIALTSAGQVAVFTFVNTPCPHVPFITPVVVITPTPGTSTPTATSTPGITQTPTPGNPGGTPTLSATEPAISTELDSTPTSTTTSSEAGTSTPVAPSTGTGRDGGTTGSTEASLAALLFGCFLIAIGVGTVLRAPRRRR